MKIYKDIKCNQIPKFIFTYCIHNTNFGYQIKIRNQCQDEGETHAHKFKHHALKFRSIGEKIKNTIFSILCVLFPFPS